MTRSFLRVSEVNDIFLDVDYNQIKGGERYAFKN